MALLKTTLSMAAIAGHSGQQNVKDMSYLVAARSS